MVCTQYGKPYTINIHLKFHLRIHCSLLSVWEKSMQGSFKQLLSGRGGEFSHVSTASLHNAYIFLGNNLTATIQHRRNS